MSRSGSPAPDRLRAQICGAKFCDCGRNSFAARERLDVSPLAPAGGRYGLDYEADFIINDSGTLEFLLFQNEYGNLALISIDRHVNASPIFYTIEARLGHPNTITSEQLLTYIKMTLHTRAIRGSGYSRNRSFSNGFRYLLRSA